MRALIERAKAIACSALVLTLGHSRVSEIGVRTLMPGTLSELDLSDAWMVPSQWR